MDKQQAGPPGGLPVAEKRGRGRPRVGEVKGIRLSDEDEATAMELGKNNLSKGVRIAIQATRDAPGIQHAMESVKLTSLLSKDDLKTAAAIGNGSPELGLLYAIRAAQFFGPEAIARVNSGTVIPPNSKPGKKRRPEHDQGDKQG